MSVDLPARPDPPDSQAVPDLRVPQARLERRVDRERKDHKAPPGEMVSRDPWVCLGLLDHWDPLERTETRERLESLARKEVKETKENMVPPDLPAPKDPLEPQVSLELMESLDPEASRVCSARRETKAPEGSPDRQAPSDSRACLDPRVRKEKLETLVRWAHPVPPAPEAPPDPQEPMAPRGPLEASETPALWERRVTQVRQENQDFRENLDHQVPGESEERRESRALLVLVDLPVLKAPPETMAPKEAQVPAVSLVIQALLESPARLVWMVLLEIRETTERPVKLVHLDPLGSLVPQVLLEREDPLVLTDPKEDKERRASRESRAWRVLQGKPVRWAPRGPQASRAPRASGASPVQWENKVFLVPPAQMDLQDLWVLQDCLV